MLFPTQKSSSGAFYFIALFLSFCQLNATYSISQALAIDVCATSFPSIYYTRSFSITEVKINGKQAFKKGQNNKILTIGFSNTNFNFNPGVGTISATGSEITINSYTISSTQIIINITSSNSQSEQNSILFSGIQIRATGPGVAILCRTGGTQTFLIENSTALPSNLISWGDFVAGSAYYQLSNATTQGLTSNVFPTSADNQIIMVQVDIAGTCGTLPAATSFSFSTAGSGLATQTASQNLSTAKLYYTGNSSIFSTGTLFGSSSLPDGAFTINGNQSFSVAGTYYFWLAYDISSAAISGQLVDASFTGLTVSSISYSATSGNPAGSRAINGSVYYTLDNGSWSNASTKWSLSFAGTPCSCVPTASSAVFISHPTLLDINSPTIFQLSILSGGTLTDNSKTLTCLNAVTTSGNGYFQATTTWSLNDVTLSGSGVSTSSESLPLTGDLYVGAGTTLQLTGGSTKLLNVNGNVTLNGVLSLGSANASASSFAGLFISGTGTITGTGTFSLGSFKDITTGSNLTIYPSLSIASGITVNNYGTVSMENNITGLASTSKWVNQSGSVLNMGGANSSLLTTGVLEASVSPNTVSYAGSAAQSIKIPSSSIYHHLTLSNAGAKTSAAALLVNGNVTISGTSQFSVAANSLTLAGNWVNNGSNSSAFISTGTVYFNNLNTISGTGLTTFNHINIGASGVLTSNSLAGKVALAGNWVNDGVFSHNSGDITFNGASLVSGNNITDFYTMIIGAAKTLTLHATETDLSGDLTINGTLTHNSALLGFDGGGNSQQINGATSELQLYQVELANTSGSVTLSRPVTITNSLTLTNGYLVSTISNVLTLSTSAVSSAGNSSSYVSGPMVKTGTAAFVFPVGKGPKWARIGIGATSSSATFRAEYFNSTHTNTTSLSTSATPTLARVSCVEYWQLDRTSGTSTAVVSLYWEDAGYSGINDCSTSDLRIAHWSGSSWENQNESISTSGSCSGATAGFITTSSGVSAFSPFTFGSKSTSTVNPLPIGLSSFTAHCDHQKTTLSWTTHSEKNSSAFILESSADAADWNVIHTMPSSGFDQEVKSYSFTDDKPTAGLTYYRLSNRDRSGLVNRYNIVYANCDAAIAEDMQFFPNPGCGTVMMAINTDQEYAGVVLNVSDQLGRTVSSQKLDLKKGLNQFPLTIDATPGIYLVALFGTSVSNPVKKLVMENCR
jgi:hypothetical protein